MNKLIIKNFSFAFLAQGISLLVSCATNLILPKIVGAEEFSYWQLFIFYSSYIPCLALGLNDGVYLRYGGTDRKDLDWNSVISQYIVGFLIQISIGVGIGAVILLRIQDLYRKIVIAASLIYFVFYSGHNYWGYIFQACNETNVYSKSLILNKAVYLAVQLALFALGTSRVFVLIPFYIFSYVLALLYLLVQLKQELRKSKFNLRLGKTECLISMKCGISLMMSNVCSMLVLGVGRQVVDMRWGVQAFGKVSFSLTLMNFALTFVSQISMVLFPALRKIKKEEIEEYYKQIEKILFLLLPFIYVVYFPGRILLNAWLPEYEESIAYLSIVLPICYFDCKMNLLSNTFFKVLNKQVDLFKVNVLTISISLAFSALGAYVFNNLLFVIYGMVASIILRSVVSDLVLHRHFHLSAKFFEFQDLLLAAVFLLAGNIFSPLAAMMIIMVLYSGRMVILHFSKETKK